MASVNKVILLGNLGADPDVRYTPDGGTAICTLSLATSRRYKNRDGQFTEETEWHRVVLFGRTAEIARDYLKKGRSVYVEAACAPASGLIRTATTVGPPKWSAKICSFLVAVTAVVKAARAVATSLPATALNPHLAPQRLVLRLLPRSRRLHLPPHRRPSTHWMKTSRSKTEGNEATPHITGSSYEKAPHCKSELFF